jgi:hypothetical protein
MRTAKRTLRLASIFWMLSVSLLGLIAARPALAEFEIQESTIDEGEIQLQYRGAQHGGLPRGVEDVDVLPDDEEAPLRQSHEFEIQMSITSHWLVAVTHGFDKLDDGDLNLTAFEAESQIELITLEGDGFGFAIQGGFEKAVQNAAKTEPDDVHFGPIVEWGQGNFLLTLNPLFFKERGPHADQDGLGFEYGWQARYALTSRLSLALESFGEIQDMADGTSFNEQEHSIGPAFYYTFGEADEEAKKGGELTVSFGGQFGLTDATSDAALKVFVGYEFF